MSGSPTTVAIFTPDQWAERLLKVYPKNWTNDAAKMAGGILYSLFETGGSQYEFLQNGLEWVLDACRIITAQDVALDAIATDFFGSVPKFEPTVVRQPGESDTSFRARILANLLQSGGTRGDISRVVALLVGVEPRIIEPWNPNDTNAADSITYLDIDTIENPSRIGDLSTPYQGFVMSQLPPYGGNGNNPVWCLDEGLACDRSFLIDPEPTWFLGPQELDMAINRVRMFATLVGRQYFNNAGASYVRGNTANPASHASSTAITLSPACIEPLVVLACAGWDSNVYVEVADEGDFTLVYGTAAPGGLGADWIAAPATIPGYGLLWLDAGVTTASMSVPINGDVVLVTPSWNTNVWLTALEDGTAQFEFSEAAPPGAYLNYGSFATPLGGNGTVNAGQNSVSINFEDVIDGPYQLIVMAGWQTDFEIVKTSSGFTAFFSNTPPADSFFYWGVLVQPY